MSEIEIVARKLADLGVGFYVEHDVPGGRRTVHLNTREVIAYAADPVGFMASRYGVSAADYLGWHESGYRVVCACRTVQGKPCKATVKGLSMVASPSEWAAHQGAYCPVHGGA